MNLKTVNALGLIAPAPLLTRADEVSECHSKRRDCDPLPQTIRRLEALSEASDKKHCSVVVAHSHLADFSSQVRADGRRISAVVAGRYIDPEDHHDWAGQQTQRTWWSGVVVLGHCDGQGGFDPSWISLDALKREYGGE